MRALLRASVGLELVAIAGAIVATMFTITLLDPDEDRTGGDFVFGMIVLLSLTLAGLMAYSAIALVTGRRWAPVTLSVAAAMSFLSLAVTIAAAVPLLACVAGLLLWPLAKHRVVR